jgi:hypothetical protein
LAEEAITREEAIERLAEYLHWKMWHLDPIPGETAPANWAELSEFDQNFFRTSVTALLQHKKYLLAAL